MDHTIFLLPRPPETASGLLEACGRPQNGIDQSTSPPEQIRCLSAQSAIHCISELKYLRTASTRHRTSLFSRDILISPVSQQSKDKKSLFGVAS